MTAPECDRCSDVTRRNEFRCCRPDYCVIALSNAAEAGVDLKITGHPILPLMGPEGCTAPPWLRPACTRHTCDLVRFGEKPGDILWTSRYLALRDEIEAIEALLSAQS